jgi:hypothetical protein
MAIRLFSFPFVAVTLVAMQHGGDAAANVTAVEQLIDRVSGESSAKGIFDSSPYNSSACNIACNIAPMQCSSVAL